MAPNITITASPTTWTVQLPRPTAIGSMSGLLPAEHQRHQRSHPAYHRILTGIPTLEYSTTRPNMTCRCFSRCQKQQVYRDSSLPSCSTCSVSQGPFSRVVSPATESAAPTDRADGVAHHRVRHRCTVSHWNAGCGRRSVSAVA